MAEGDKPPGDGNKPQPQLHFVVIGDGAEAVPKPVTADKLDALTKGLHDALLETKKGWAYVFIDGQRCRVSQPIQVFLLKLPDGKTVELRGDEPTFPEDGAFKCLDAEE